ncbi:MAG: hypothetical protein LBJ73_04495 [Rickettsiales bacterium]|jgi:hypothetical protein|nr:hypothetical protein [Rickettsiales bacterium]
MIKTAGIFMISIVTLVAVVFGVGPARADLASKDYVERIVGNISLMPGPAGPTGATGATGATGPAGPTGPAGSVNAVNVTGTGNMVTEISGTSTLAVTKGNVQIPVGSATATTYATIWVE